MIGMRIWKKNLEQSTAESREEKKMSNEFEDNGDFYHEVFSGYFHTVFEISTFLLVQLVGNDLLLTIVLRVSECKVRAKYWV